MRELGLEDLTLGVKKKGDLVAHTLAFYEYMFDAVDIKPTTGVRMSEVSKHQRGHHARGGATSKTLASRGGTEDATTPRLEYETDPSRMDYVKASVPKSSSNCSCAPRASTSGHQRARPVHVDRSSIITTARSKQHLRALAGAVLHAVKARTEYVAGGQLQPVVEGAGKERRRRRLARRRLRVVHGARVLSPMVARRDNLEELWASGGRGRAQRPRAFDDRYHRFVARRSGVSERTNDGVSILCKNTYVRKDERNAISSYSF